MEQRSKSYFSPERSDSRLERWKDLKVAARIQDVSCGLAALRPWGREKQAEQASSEVKDHNKMDLGLS